MRQAINFSLSRWQYCVYHTHKRKHVTRTLLCELKLLRIESLIDSQQKTMQRKLLSAHTYGSNCTIYRCVLHESDKLRNVRVAMNSCIYTLFALAALTA